MLQIQGLVLLYVNPGSTGPTGEDARPLNSNESISEEEQKQLEEESKRFFNTLNNYLTWRAIMPFVTYLSKGELCDTWPLFVPHSLGNM